MITNWRSGTPSIAEWNGAWRAVDSEGEVTQEEWQTVWKSLDKYLTKLGKNGFADDCDFFLRSTWFREHRSQVIELVNPQILTIELLQRLQDWIRGNFPTWRIIIPLFLGESNLVIIYANTLRNGVEFESDWETGLSCARRAMLDLKQFQHIKQKYFCPPLHLCASVVKLQFLDNVLIRRAHIYSQIDFLKHHPTLCRRHITVKAPHLNPLPVWRGEEDV